MGLAPMESANIPGERVCFKDFFIYHRFGTIAINPRDIVILRVNFFSSHFGPLCPPGGPSPEFVTQSAAGVYLL
jgi:hypothetical protein